MKVSVATIKKMIREAVEECYSENMEEQAGSWRPRSVVPPAVPQHDTAADRYDSRTVGSAARAGRMDFTPTSTGAAPAATPASTTSSSGVTEQAAPASHVPGGEGESGIAGNKPSVHSKTPVSEAAKLRSLVRALVSEALSEQAPAAAAPAVAAPTASDPLSAIERLSEQYTSGGTWRPSSSTSRTPGGSGESGIGNKPTARGSAGEGRARGLSYERGADVTARRAASAADRAASPAASGAMTDAEWSNWISGLASGAPRPGSALPARTASTVVPLADRMASLAAARSDKASRRREGGWGGGARPGAVPPVPAAPTAVADGEDPLAGIPAEALRMAEAKTIREMVRKAVQKALAEQKKNK